MKPQVEPTPGARVRTRPIDAGAMRFTGGFWADQQRTNRVATIPHGLVQLEASGALDNFRRAAGSGGGYRGGTDDAGSTFPFLDTDVYKWLEGVGWELGRAPDAALAALADPVIEAVVAAQRPDGYLGTFVQLGSGVPFRDLEWGHELYNIGHLIQAAVAWKRTVGDERLLTVATRAVAFIREALGPGRRAGIDGHPEIEMALVELYRETGDPLHLELARHLVDERGHGLLGRGRFGDQYWQDHLPVRDAPTVTGHAVRQMYLDCGAVDVATETGDAALLDAVVRRWDDMVATRTYLTGALGARHHGESFGDRFELPPDRAYAETCAAIGSVMLAWRLWLATGHARFGDAIERALYNSVISGRSLDGTGFYYVNPLLVRAGATGYGGAQVKGRAPWYACACCPPNLMRLLASLDQMAASVDVDGVRLGQYATGELRVDGAAGPIRLAITTDYPWDGRVTVEILETPAQPWTLRLRIPAWSGGGALHLDDTPIAAVAQDGFASVERGWSPGDRLTLDLPMAARRTIPDPRIDAIRGCAAIERGPIVYCLEQADLPPGAALESVRMEREGALETVPTGPLGLPAVRVPVTIVAKAPAAWPYTDDGSPDGPGSAPPSPMPLIAIPYFAWANRVPGAMRVWVPLADA